MPDDDAGGINLDAQCGGSLTAILKPDLASGYRRHERADHFNKRIADFWLLA
jgi:hypothetical protein